MAGGRQVLQLFVVGGRGDDEDRATVLVDQLAGKRDVSGDSPEWEAIYEARDATEAMRQCAQDLDELDPDWLKILDFKAVSFRRLTSVTRDRA